MSKVKFADLVKKLENELKRKRNLGQRQKIDDELHAWITIYKHGAKDYKVVAIEYLCKFFVNANFVKGIRSISLEGESNE